MELSSIPTYCMEHTTCKLKQGLYVIGSFPMNPFEALSDSAKEYLRVLSSYSNKYALNLKPYSIHVLSHRQNAVGRYEYLFEMFVRGNHRLFWDLARDHIQEKEAKKYWETKAMFSSEYQIIEGNIDHLYMPQPDDFPNVTSDQFEMAEKIIHFVGGSISCFMDDFLSPESLGLAFTSLSSDLSFVGPYLIVCPLQSCSSIQKIISSITNLPSMIYFGTPIERTLLRESVFPGLDEVGNLMFGYFSYPIVITSEELVEEDMDVFFNKVQWISSFGMVVPESARRSIPKMINVSTSDLDPPAVLPFSHNDSEMPNNLQVAPHPIIEELTESDDEIQNGEGERDLNKIVTLSLSQEMESAPKSNLDPTTIQIRKEKPKTKDSSSSKEKTKSKTKTKLHGKEKKKDTRRKLATEFHPLPPISPNGGKKRKISALEIVGSGAIIGSRLENAAKDMGMTKSELVRASGCSVTAVKKAESKRQKEREALRRMKKSEERARRYQELEKRREEEEARRRREEEEEEEEEEGKEEEDEEENSKEEEDLDVQQSTENQKENDKKDVGKFEETKSSFIIDEEGSSPVVRRNPRRRCLRGSSEDTSESDKDYSSEEFTPLSKQRRARAESPPWQKRRRYGSRMRRV